MHTYILYIHTYIHTYILAYIHKVQIEADRQIGRYSVCRQAGR